MGYPSVADRVRQLAEHQYNSTHDTYHGGRMLKEDGTSIVNLADIIGSSNGIVYQGTTAGASPQVVAVTLPTVPQPQAQYVVFIANDGDEAVTVALQQKETFAETAKYGTLVTLDAVASGEAAAVPVQGWLVGEGGRISLSSAAAINCSIRVRKV